MAGGRTANAAGSKGPAVPRDRNLSGAAWWSKNQAKFANSTDIADLKQPFRSAVQDFVQALVKAGATVEVFATLRNPIRTYLMRYSWDVSHHLIAPSKVPPKAGCPINWDHGNDAKSRAAAQEMASMFRIVYSPSVTSRDIEGLAIDMDISWTGSIPMTDKNGMSFILGAPQSGATNRTLHAIGATYGVYKLLSDTLHWSSDGH